MAKVFTITEGLENMGALRTGGQGSVYKGRRVGQIITAVKLLPTPIYSESLDDKNFRDFQSEVNKLKKVNEVPNPNVVKILNSGITESGSLPFIEMEFIEGPDLEELLKPPHDSVFSVRDAIRVADQLSNALAHCHKIGVKHGDIKSNNVKLNIHTGNYMLLDFGLAIMSDEQRRSSLRHAGAIEFMAPEQNSGEMLFETDVYSFGIILFELLAGVVPFPLRDNGETARNAVMISHLETPVPDLMALRAAHLPPHWSDEKKAREMRVPSWLLRLISKCLEKQPANRFKNGVELHEAIVSNIILATDTNPATASESLGELQQENARLKSLLLQYQQEAELSPNVANLKSGPATSIKNKRASAVPWLGGAGLSSLRPVVAGVIILLSCLTLFAGFSVFTGPKTKNAIDTVAINAEKQRLRDSIRLLENLNTRRIQDSIDNERRYNALRKKLLAAQQADDDRDDDPKPKRKKGLRKLFDIRFKKED